MSSTPLILSIDQGTTNTKAILVDARGAILCRASHPVRPRFPVPGWVELDPQEIWESVHRAARDCLEAAGSPSLSGIAVTNQRESVVMWDRRSGEPVGPVVIWQCRRTSAYCRDLRKRGVEDTIRRRTGLPIDPLFSASKLRWLVDNVSNGRRRAEAGELAAGTVDSWILWKLTDGAVHATDASNASRTQLFNLETLSWDDELLALFEVPKPLLPRIDSSDARFGESVGGGGIPSGVAIAGVLGDSHAALLGHRAFNPGAVKATYGTGSSLVSPVSELIFPESGLAATVAWQLEGRTTYAFEGNISVSGAVIDWCTELLGLEDASAMIALATSVSSSDGVYVVPAFVGLGAPHWNGDARGLITGITRSTGPPQIARAVLESVAYQVRDVFEAMAASMRVGPGDLLADGGASRSDALMQIQADVLGHDVLRNNAEDLSALGAAFAAGLGLGIWSDIDEIAALPRDLDRFEPSCTDVDRERRVAGWRAAIAKTTFSTDAHHASSDAQTAHEPAASAQ